MINKWDLRFLDLAKTWSQYSKDPSTKTGCVIANDKFQLGIGYNGFPSCIEDKEEWYNDRETKLKLVSHCERNALIDALAKGSVHGCTMYTYPFPSCGKCAQEIASWGIKKVIAPFGRFHDESEFVFNKTKDVMWIWVDPEDWNKVVKYRLFHNET